MEPVEYKLLQTETPQQHDDIKVELTYELTGWGEQSSGITGVVRGGEGPGFCCGEMDRELALPLLIGG